MDVVIGVDAGTTATKGVSAGVDARLRDLSSVGYALQVPQRGWAELDPHRLRSAVVQALTEVGRAAVARGDRVVGVSLSAAMHGLVPLDAGGTPVGPLQTWADGRAGPQADRLRDRGLAAALHSRTGTPVHPMSPLPKLMWWREQGVLSGATHWGGVKELMVSALLGHGHHVVDLSCASATGMYDAARGRWDDEALALTGVRRDQLAEVVPTTQVLGALRPDVAAAAGLPAGVPVVAGASDGPLANLGVGAVSPGVAAVSLGTSAALRAVRPGHGVDAAGRLFSYALTADRWVVGGAINNGASVVRWAAQAFTDGPELTGEEADDRDVRLLAEAAAVPPGAAGLVCLPYLLGERAPWWRSDLSGAYLGLRRDHRRAHLVRAAVEGVCQQLALVRDAFDAVDVAVDEVRVTGGAAASTLWVTTLAAALDLPVKVADSPEGTGLGACLLGWHALGGLDDLDRAAELVEVSDPVLPDPAVAARYRRTRAVVDEVVQSLGSVLPRLES